MCVGACVTATDPVLASSVVGKGKFAKRVPGHLRNLLSAESGSNDGMAFPFLYLALYIILDNYSARRALKDWILITVLYEVVMGSVLGALIGIGWRKAIKFAERRCVHWRIVLMADGLLIGRVFLVSTLSSPFSVLGLELCSEQTIFWSPSRPVALSLGSTSSTEILLTYLVDGSQRRLKNPMSPTSSIFSSTCHSSFTTVPSFPGVA